MQLINRLPLVVVLEHCKTKIPQNLRKSMNKMRMGGFFQKLNEGSRCL